MLTQVLPHVKQSNNGSKSQIISALANIAEQWQEAAEGESLVDVQTSVGLLLFDVLLAIGLNREEQETVLGAGLRREVIREIVTRDGGGTH
jgi:hypothetical protein